MASYRTREDFDQLMQRLAVAHQSQVNSLQVKVEKLQKALKSARMRSSSSVMSDSLPSLQDSDQRPFALAGELSQDTSAFVSSELAPVPAPAPENQEADESPVATMTSGSRRTRFLFADRKFSAAENSSEEFEKGKWTFNSILANPRFEAGICLMIFANAVVFALEAQNTGMQWGWTYIGGDLPGQIWSDSDMFFTVLENVFGVIFTIEVVLRLSVRKCHFFCGMWNWLDLTIVVVWLISKAVEELPLNSQVLRLARLIRLFRLLRLVRRIQQFDSLYLMSTAIRSSFGILAWTAALLFIVQMLFALVLNQILYGFYFNAANLESQLLKDRQELVYVYFGTFSRALLTMFEITLANWPPVCRALTENVTEWFMIFFLVHKVTMGFAVIGVINGVLMQETFKVASYDDTIMMRTKQKAMRNHIKKMQLLFDEADTSEDGKIDLQEFQEILKDNELKAWLGAMELDIRDVGECWELLQEDAKDRSGGLSAEQLVVGVAKLQGTAKSLDLMKVIKVQESMMSKIHRLERDVNTVKRNAGDREEYLAM
ncbi:unnamed protein product [Effrenium voratum]|nr:unnamed protein product [Effrenium voratum]